MLARIRTITDLRDAKNLLPLPRQRAAAKRKSDATSYIHNYDVYAHEVIGHDSKGIEFKNLNQKFIYSQLSHEKSVDHSYQTR